MIFLSKRGHRFRSALLSASLRSDLRGAVRCLAEQKRCLRCVFYSLLILTLSVWASGQALADIDTRRDLSQQIHRHYDVAEQVEAAIERIANLQPEADQARYKIALRQILNIRALKLKSIETMAEVYSEEELQTILNAPDEIALSDDYAAIMGPFIVEMLDKAMMRMRLEGP